MAKYRYLSLFHFCTLQTEKDEINPFTFTFLDIDILDVACGIGVVGEELRAAGYNKVSRI